MQVDASISVKGEVRHVEDKSLKELQRGWRNSSDLAPQEELGGEDLKLCFEDEKNVLNVCYFVMKLKAWCPPISGEPNPRAASASTPIGLSLIDMHHRKKGLRNSTGTNSGSQEHLLHRSS